MRTLKIAFYLAAAFAIILSAGPAAAQQSRMLRMGGSDWPVWETARAMAALNQLKGITFRSDKYDSCLNGFKNGTYEITFMTLYDFIASQRQNSNGVVIAATDYSAGGDGIVLRKNLAASALKGKALGLQPTTISLYIAHLFLSKSGMSLNDIKIVPIKADMVSAAFKSNSSLSGIIGWNPNLDEALADGGNRIATSADFPETVFDVIVVNRESLAANHEIYAAFVRSWFEAVNNSAIAEKTAALLKVSPDGYVKWLKDAVIYRDAAASLGSYGRMKVVAADIQLFFQKAPESVTGPAASLFGGRPLAVESLFDESILLEIQKH